MSDDLKGKALGAILLQSQIITPEQVEAALAEQRRTGRRFGEVLMDLGIVSAEDVRWGLSQQQAYSFVRVRPEAVDPEAVRAVPADVARRLMVVPFLLVGDELTVVMDDPTNRQALAELAEVTGRTVVASIGLPDEIRAALDACYGPVEATGLDESVLGAVSRDIARAAGFTPVIGPRGPATSRALAFLVGEVARPGDRVFHLGPSGMTLPPGAVRLRLPAATTAPDPTRIQAALGLDPDLLCIEDLYDPGAIEGALRAAAGGCRVLGVLPIASPGAAMEYLVEQARSRAVLASSLAPAAVVVHGDASGRRVALVPVTGSLRAAIRSRPPRSAGVLFGRAARGVFGGAGPGDVQRDR